jgi:hypothetical protein
MANTNRRNQRSMAGQPTDEWAPNLYFDFWTQFREFMIARGSPVSIYRRGRNTDYRTNVSLGRTGFKLQGAVTISRAKADVWLITDGPRAKTYYHALETHHKADLERELGPLLWSQYPEGKTCYVGVTHPFAVADRSVWSEIDAWLGDTLERFQAAFGPIVQNLRVDEPAPSVPLTADAQSDGPLDDDQ